MRPDELSQAWAKQAQLDAERGVIECRICQRMSKLDETTTLWRDGFLVFALCDDCVAGYDILMHQTSIGIEVRARSRVPLIGG